MAYGPRPSQLILVLCGHDELMRRNRQRASTNRERHCCRRLARAVALKCARHPDPTECPDALVGYSPGFDEYGIRVHDGGTSMVLIHFCPWCGTKLPASKRHRWFEELEGQGIDPAVDIVPSEYQTDRWWRRPRRAGAR